jgi:uncharacterized protein (DUF4415 family)
MLSERLQQRLRRDRPMTSITLRIPVDVVESLKTIAPRKGLTGYQALLKAYVSEGLRRDEALLAPSANEQLIEALRQQGVAQEQLDAALRQVRE